MKKKAKFWQIVRLALALHVLRLVLHLADERTPWGEALVLGIDDTLNRLDPVTDEMLQA